MAIILFIPFGEIDTICFTIFSSIRTIDSEFLLFPGESHNDDADDILELHSDNTLRSLNNALFFRYPTCNRRGKSRIHGAITASLPETMTSPLVICFVFL
jgi:hypothetical protein